MEDKEKLEQEEHCCHHHDHEHEEGEEKECCHGHHHHDHEHEEGEKKECCHGHHHHDHEHEDGEEKECCHGHHHHEHEHGEGEEHEHHHHEGGVDVHVHEGAVAASFEKDLTGSQDEIITRLKGCMEALRAEIKEHHGVIGHIKASITSAQQTTMLSLTKDIIDEKCEQGSVCRVCFAAIVFNIEEEHMEELVEELVYDVL